MEVIKIIAREKSRYLHAYSQLNVKRPLTYEIWQKNQDNLTSNQFSRKFQIQT